MKFVSSLVTTSSLAICYGAAPRQPREVMTRRRRSYTVRTARITGTLRQIALTLWMSFESTVQWIRYSTCFRSSPSLCYFCLTICTHSIIPDLVIIIERLECQNDVSAASSYLGGCRSQTQSYCHSTTTSNGALCQCRR